MNDRPSQDIRIVPSLSKMLISVNTLNCPLPYFPSTTDVSSVGDTLEHSLLSEACSFPLVLLLILDICLTVDTGGVQVPRGDSTYWTLEHSCQDLSWSMKYFPKQLLWPASNLCGHHLNLLDSNCGSLGWAAFHAERGIILHKSLQPSVEKLAMLILFICAAQANLLCLKQQGDSKKGGWKGGKKERKTEF